MAVNLRAGFVQCVNRRPAQLKLATWLDADVLPVQGRSNDILPLHHRFPSKPTTQVLQEKLDGAIFQALGAVQVIAQLFMLCPNPANTKNVELALGLKLKVYKCMTDRQQSYDCLDPTNTQQRSYNRATTCETSIRRSKKTQRSEWVNDRDEYEHQVLSHSVRRGPCI
jgi:hypothetical protein